MINVLNQVITDRYSAYHGDSIEVVGALPTNSIHYSVFSPPFAALYVYSSSDRCLGNSKDQDQFFRHFDFLTKDLLRVTMPGRLLSAHCMNLPTLKHRDGYVGLVDFRGELIRAFVRHGWIYASETTIWKDPVAAVTRTHALGLLHKTIRTDAAMTRAGLPDYLVTFRKPGDNPEPVTNTDESFPVERWQRYASPVWASAADIDEEGFVRYANPSNDNPDKRGIHPSETLQYMSAREDADERHLCVLQLPIIRRCIRHWTNPNDIVLSPFMGIGSEGYVALQEGRRFVGSELKASYFKQAAGNLRNATVNASQGSIFDVLSTAPALPQLAAPEPSDPSDFDPPSMVAEAKCQQELSVTAAEVVVGGGLVITPPLAPYVAPAGFYVRVTHSDGKASILVDNEGKMAVFDSSELAESRCEVMRRINPDATYGTHSTPVGAIGGDSDDEGATLHTPQQPVSLARPAPKTRAPRKKRTKVASPALDLALEAAATDVGQVAE